MVEENQIITSLSGKYTQTTYKGEIILWIIGGLLIAIFLPLFLTRLLPQGQWGRTTVFFLIAVVLGVPFIFAGIYTLVDYKQTKKRLPQVIGGASKIKAFTKILDVQVKTLASGYGATNIVRYKIELDFKHKNESHTMTSKFSERFTQDTLHMLPLEVVVEMLGERKTIPTWKTSEMDTLHFSDHVKIVGQEPREVSILYSPKYKEVFFLKEKLSPEILAKSMSQM